MLLTLVAIFSAVFLIDYAVYAHNPAQYSYVSRRTLLLFLGGKVFVVWYFWDVFLNFSSNWTSEIICIAILWSLLMLFTALLSRERQRVCHTESRSERCLTPMYVLVKGEEIGFQQVVYLGVALSLIPLFGTGFWAYSAYTFVLLIMHSPVVYSMNTAAMTRLTFGLCAISAPIFYSFTELQLLWPAIYLHAIMYVFLWLTFADWDGIVPPKKHVSRVTGSHEIRKSA